MRAAPPGSTAGDEQHQLDLFDYQHIRNVIGFVIGGVRRHKALSLTTFVSVAALGLLAAALWPRTYHAESRLLANQNQLIRALGNPRSSLPSEDPTRAAKEIIFARNNLVSLIKETNLLKSWQETRPAIVKVKDSVMRLLSGPLTEDDQIDAMVGTLEKWLRVDTDAQTVTISIDWPDAQAAYLLVETAQQNFLETRHVTEMTAISEALSILEMHAGGVQKTVEDSLHELERVREQRRTGAAPPVAVKGPQETAKSLPAAAAAAAPVKALEDEPKPNAPPSATEQELAQLKFLLNSKRRALTDLEDFRSRRVTELTAQLQEQKIQYADQHPIVRETLQRIDAMKADSPQIAQVKADIASLLQEYSRKGGKDPDALIEPRVPGSSRRAGPGQTARVANAALSNAELADDPLVEYSRNNLRVAAAKYEELMMRIDGARIEQDTARAAFKYRYSVVRPASVPKKPVKPNVALILIASFMLAFGAALFIGAARDLSRDSFVEPWQVERALGLKVLSRLREP